KDERGLHAVRWLVVFGKADNHRIAEEAAARQEAVKRREALETIAAIEIQGDRIRIGAVVQQFGQRFVHAERACGEGKQASACVERVIFVLTSGVRADWSSAYWPL